MKNMLECSSSASVQGISGTASTAKQVSVKLADCNDEYPTLKSVRPLAEPGSHAESGSGKTGHHSDARRSGYPPPMAAVRLYRRAGTPSTPQDGGLICSIRSRSDRVLPEWWALE
jgi:hypothetical protein